MSITRYLVSIYYRTASTAQQSTAQHSSVNPHKWHSKYAPIRARQRKQADRVGSSQQVVEHLQHAVRCVLYERKKSKSARPTKKHNHLFTKQLSWCDVPGVCLSVLSISSMHRASGLFSWTMELLTFASRQFAPKTMDLSVRFIYSQFVQFFLVSEAPTYNILL